MKDYKQNRAYIGDSDIASLTVRFPGQAEVLNFGQDQAYHAWVVHDFADEEIPAHYEKKLSGVGWMHIYDDEGLAFRTASAKRYSQIDIYRAGEMGVLINLIGGYDV